MKLHPTGHEDTFARENLPPFDQWPDLLLDRFDSPDRLNVGVELTDKMVEKGFGDHTALIGNGRRRTYKELADWTNRLASALVEDLGVKPGNRVLIRSANNPAMVACWLAATKAGAVVVNTMPMLRAGELQGAGLDVYEHGTDINPRLRELTNVVLLPHMGSATLEGRVEMGEKVIINIKTFADGHRPPDQVVPSML